ncbi:hypothetical protein Cgig2_030802 [Carnegiea gigantea]|uniref:Uncharacterized protein n=1 Tax=Carnegiea gigantea TaxID=171969 RepID=A0A9Q1KQG5_9CARY|nr:hypothetical protein Cgig2_030802 [Carnegiea gigantea]
MTTGRADGGGKAISGDGDELHNVKDIETSDEEWEVATNNLRKFKRHSEVEAQRAAVKHNSEVSTICENGSEYEELDADLDTPLTIDEKDNMILRKRDKKKRVKIDEYTDYKKLKWEVRMTFGTMHKFKQTISCGTCKQRGHNKRSYSNKDQASHPQPKRGRGRPTLNNLNLNLKFNKYLLPPMLKEEEAELQEEA